MVSMCLSNVQWNSIALMEWKNYKSNDYSLQLVRLDFLTLINLCLHSLESCYKRTYPCVMCGNVCVCV